MTTLSSVIAKYVYFEEKNVIIVVAGAAGSGKSTLGRELARSLCLPILDLDTLTNPLLEGIGKSLFSGRHWNDVSLRSIIRPARYAALLSTIAEQVAVGSDAVAVAPFTAELQGGGEWELLSVAAGGTLTVVWLSASAKTLTARRASRAAARDGHIVDPPAGGAPRVPYLLVDAALATSQQVAIVKRQLDLAEAPSADLPIFLRTFAGGLFDLDGTLIDSTPSVNRSWRQLAEEYELTIDLLAEGHGQPAARVIASVFPPYLADEALARVIEIEAADMDGVVVLPGAESFLTAIPASLAAIVTSGTMLVAGNRIAASGITKPSTLITFDDVTNGKPDPEPFLLAASRLGLDPTQCVAFEDAPAGLAAARAAGCTTVGIVGTHEAHELDADLVVDGLYQLAVELMPEGGFRLKPAGVA
jgi:sugar-phosphatase